MNKDEFDLLLHKLDTMSRLLAGNLLKDAKTKTQKVEILTELGIANKEIAQLIGGSEATVKVLKSQLKHRKKTRGVKKSGED